MALFGWRARIGFISPLRGRIHTSEIEMQMVAPEGVLIHSAYLDGPKSLGLEDLRAVLPQVAPAAQEVTGSTPMDVIVQGGAPVCLANGTHAIIDTITDATGVPATTVLNGLINGMRRLDMRKVVVVTPYYPDDLAELTRKFVEESGFDIAELVTGGDVEFAKHKEISPEGTYRLAKEAFLRAPRSDGLLLVGGGAPINTVLQTLETDIGKPVVASNFASAWNALTMASVREPIHGYGKLLTCF